jgi:hypothetical protein
MDIVLREDADVTITATPATGYSFVEWGGITLSDNTITEATFKMPSEDVTLMAEFALIPTYEIKLPTITGQGSVEVRVDGVGPIGDGERFYEDQTVNIKSIPAEGWRFVSIAVNIVAYPIPTPDLTFDMPNQDIVISEAIFEEILVITPPTQKPSILKPDGSAYGAYDYPSLASNGGSMTLTSSEVEGATGYRWMKSGAIYQEGPERTLVATMAGNYQVQGYNEGGDGPWSNGVNILK